MLAFRGLLQASPATPTCRGELHLTCARGLKPNAGAGIIYDGNAYSLNTCLWVSESLRDCIYIPSSDT